MILSCYGQKIYKGDWTSLSDFTLCQ